MLLSRLKFFILLLFVQTILNLPIEYLFAVEANRNEATKKICLGLMVPDDLVYSSEVIDQILHLKVAKLARTDAPVLIVGDTGVGKERIAESILINSSRKSGPYLVFNFAAITNEIATDTLFGHKRGAFTGANQDRKGLFEEADGGTIFLDEIGDASSEVQAMLLRVLQSGEVTPLGSNRAIQVNVRVIAATNKNLLELSQDKPGEKAKFRTDLLYRLLVGGVRVPSLAERPEDILKIAQYYVESYSSKYGKNISGLTHEAQDFLRGYDFPGNIRELQNMIHSAVIFADEGLIGIDNLADSNVHSLFQTAQQPNPQIKSTISKAGKVKVSPPEIDWTSDVNKYSQKYDQIEVPLNIYKIESAAILQALVRAPLTALGQSDGQLATNVAKAADQLNLTAAALNSKIREGTKKDFYQSFLARLNQLKVRARSNFQTLNLDDFIDFFGSDSVEGQYLRMRLDTLEIEELKKRTIIFAVLQSSKDTLFKSGTTDYLNPNSVNYRYLAEKLGLSDPRSLHQLLIDYSMDLVAILKMRTN